MYTTLVLTVKDWSGPDRTPDRAQKIICPVRTGPTTDPDRTRLFLYIFLNFFSTRWNFISWKMLFYIQIFSLHSGFFFELFLNFFSPCRTAWNYDNRIIIATAIFFFLQGVSCTKKSSTLTKKVLQCGKKCVSTFGLFFMLRFAWKTKSSTLAKKVIQFRKKIWRTSLFLYIF